jgi:ribosomal protein S18 acetylase RimI-like enzyme
MSLQVNVQIALHSERPIDAQAVQALYAVAHWWPQRSADALAQVLDQHPAVGLWDAAALIGFARAVTDGAFRAYIEDVVVHPAYRRQGLARALVARLLAALEHIETISLFCTPEVHALYAQLGFKARQGQLVMHRAGNS